MDTMSYFGISSEMAFAGQGRYSAETPPGHPADYRPFSQPTTMVPPSTGALTTGMHALAGAQRSVKPCVFFACCVSGKAL
jgi:hypothetical protein